MKKLSFGEVDVLLEQAARGMLRDNLEMLRGHIEGLEQELVIAEKFHKVAVSERDFERVQNQRLREAYHDLLYQVGSAYPGESRHDTAKRYIREHESRTWGEAKETP